MANNADFKFVPSPVPLQYSWIYTATANPSGRMQYHKIKPGVSKERISRTEFLHIYNNANILGIRPLQEKEAQVFQLEFYI